MLNAVLPFSELADDRSQREPGDELHRVIVDARFAANRVNRHDVRMMQMGRGLDLDLKPLNRSGVERGGVR